MAYSVYIDVDKHPPFISGDEYGTDIITRQFGIKVYFICNSLAKISKGDIYEVPFENPEDAIVFILKNPYSTIDKNKVEKYKEESKRKRGC
jgi:hypothetical protein